ncbi:MAG: hypothetical protein ACP5KN_05270 [Armatimonadota bacterium]
MRQGRTERLLRSRFGLLVSLPRNDPTLARAALEAGADGLKVHIGLSHFASGLDTGSLAEEQDGIRQIVELGAPVGIVPGVGEQMAGREEMRRLAEMGIDFFDLYATDMPAWMLRMDDCAMSVMVAFSATCRPWALVEEVGGASRPELIEASIMPHEAYGEALTAADVSEYAAIARRATQPVIAPTQKAIQPEEVGVLIDCGLAGVLIGAIVTGTEPTSLARATESFRAAIDAQS